MNSWLFQIDRYEITDLCIHGLEDISVFSNSIPEKAQKQ